MGFIKYYLDPKNSAFSIKHCNGQSHAFRKHVHEAYAIIVVLKGETNFTFVEDEFIIHSAQMVLMSPELPHQCVPTDVENFEFYMLQVSPVWLSLAGVNLEAFPNFSIIDLNPESYNRLIKNFKNACEHINNAEEWVLEIIEAAFLYEHEEIIGTKHSQSEDLLLSQIYEELKLRYRDNLLLEAFAQKTGIDRFTLIRKFYKQYNSTPMSLQIMYKVNEAKRLLEQGYQITEAALEAGFYDQSHLTKIFKQSFGVTPNQFVRNKLVNQ